MGSAIADDASEIASPPRVLDRVRLRFRALNEARTTAIWAPAGFGKSTLLRLWAAELTDGGDRVVHIDAGAATHAMSLEAIVEGALSGGDAEHRVAVLIDNVHLLSSVQDKAWLAAFAAHRSPLIRLIIAGRFAPVVIPHAAGSEFLELRAADLAFTSSETLDYFSLHGIALAQEDLDRVLDRTDGWIAALSLMVIWLRDAVDLRVRIMEFSGDNRAIADYLVTEVLATITPNLREFMVSIAVTDEITAPLALALTGRADAADILEAISCQSSLLVRTTTDGDPEEEPVYRYHTVVRSYLRAELRRAGTTRAQDLRRRATAWYGAHRHLDIALSLAVAAEDMNDIMTILDEDGALLVFSGHGGLVEHAIDVLHDAGFDPPIGHVLALLLATPHMVDTDRVDAQLNVLAESKTLSRSMTTLAQGALLFRHPIEIPDELIALSASGHDNGTGHPRSREHRNGEHAAVYARAAGAWRMLRTGAESEGIDELRRAASSAREQRLSWLHILILDIAVKEAASMGRWEEAETLQDELNEFARSLNKPSDLVAARVQLAAATTAYQRCQPYPVHQLQDILEMDSAHLDLALTLPTRSVRLLFAIDADANPRPALEELDVLLQGSSHLYPGLLATAMYRYADLTLRYHGPARARKIAQFTATILGADSVDAGVALLLADAGTVRQRSSEHALEELLTGSGRVWESSNRVYGWMLLAHLADQAGRSAHAEARLIKALEIASASQLRRPFLAGHGLGAAMIAERTGRLGEYEDFAMSVREADQTIRPAAARGAVQTAAEMTHKEQELLRELPRHQSVVEIAKRYQLSPNTIKTHLRAIYQKLGVNGRSEAVDEATRRGLL